jgi:transposase
MKPYRVLTDEEWLAVAPLLPELQPRKETRGRPLTNTREVLNGVLWVMHSGSSWSMLPRRFPSYQTCHRRFKAWQRTGVLKTVLNRLFGPSGDEFHTAIVARMRHPQPEGGAAKPKRNEGAHVSGAPGPDTVWDAAPLHNAFSPMPSRAPLMACEPGVAMHDDAYALACAAVDHASSMREAGGVAITAWANPMKGVSEAVSTNVAEAGPVSAMPTPPLAPMQSASTHAEDPSPQACVPQAFETPVDATRNAESQVSENASTEEPADEEDPPAT